MIFDWSISIGSVIVIVINFIMLLLAWRVFTQSRKDLEWRINNLEIWRKEHMLDSDSRKNLLLKIDKILYHIMKEEKT